MLVGTNEFGTMKGVGYYLSHHKTPAFLFTSDANSRYATAKEAASTA